MCEIEEAFEAAERSRLLYVAATRAREMLVVSIWKQGKSENAHGPWSPLAPFLAEDLPEPGPPAAVDPPRPLTRLPEVRSAFAPAAGAAEASGQATYAVTPVARRARSPRPAWGGPAAACPGAACCRLLEALMRDPGRRACAANLLARKSGRPATSRSSSGAPKAFAPPTSGIALPPRRLVEVPFALMARREELGLADGPAETLLQGAIDLVFEEKGAWTLVDYKSDTVGDKLDELVAFYTPQIAIYRRYWERLTGSPKRAGLFFAETGQEVWPALPR
jgi:ATP-dependent helicase/nuclease subunit A